LPGLSKPKNDNRIALPYTVIISLTPIGIACKIPANLQLIKNRLVILRNTFINDT